MCAFVRRLFVVAAVGILMGTVASPTPVSAQAVPDFH